MHSAKKLQAIGSHPPNRRLVENDPKPALYARIWTRLLTALHESRKKEAAHLIRRHRDLIQNCQAIEFPGRGDALETAARSSPERYVMIERVLIAVVLVGFALAHVFALHRLDAVAKDVGSSLAVIATTGD